MGLEPLTYESWCSYLTNTLHWLRWILLWKNKYTIKLMPNFSTHILQTININAHFNQISYIYAAFKPHRHCKHTFWMHSSQGDLNHWSMDLDEALLPILYNSRHEYRRKNKYTIKLIPNFSTNTLQTININAHLTHTSNM